MITFEAARPDDVPVLCDLLALLFTQEREFQPEPQAQRRGLMRILASPDVGQIWVARDVDGTVLGMVNLLFTVSTALGATVALLEDLVVVPDARGRGIGSALLVHALAQARSCGCRRVTLLTDHDNFAAQRFYARHGFKASGMLPMRR